LIQGWQGEQKIRAILPVHEFGYPADMIEICKIASEYDLFVVEDAACAIGSTLDGQHLGTFGDIGCFSFHPRKMLTTGEGGAIVTSDATLAGEIEQLRNHGMSFNQGSVSFGQPALNFRLTDIQSAIGLVQLAKIPAAIESRSKLASRYSELLYNEALVSIPASIEGQNWQTYMIVLDASVDRAKVIASLKELGIESNLGAQSISQMPSFKPYLEANIETPMSNNLYRQGLALPLTEQYTIDDIDHITKQLLHVLKSV
ncbi:MAG: dTDP-4-amino-4,6-dideoxygalactose transaminase, partial [Arenicella sp.]